MKSRKRLDHHHMCLILSPHTTAMSTTSLQIFSSPMDSRKRSDHDMLNSFLTQEGHVYDITLYRLLGSKKWQHSRSVFETIKHGFLTNRIRNCEREREKKRRSCVQVFSSSPSSGFRRPLCCGSPLKELSLPG